ncbi:MAG: hypothetical protein DLM69_11990 [Candidatus Chloroheliales bacterium]|nr:MAG: hypothetical protein DLM69_11990 [Chloroflexota bacterium]
MNKHRIVLQTGLLIAALALLLNGSHSPAQASKANQPAAAKPVQPSLDRTLAPTSQSNRDFEVIQALADEDLIVGKDTVARVAGGGNVTIKVNGGACTVLFQGGQCSGSTKDESGATIVPLGRPVSSAVGKTFTISAGNRSVKRSVMAVDAKLDVFFLPVDWTAEMRSNPSYDYPNAIHQMTSASCDFMKAVYPVPPDNITCNSTDVPYMLRPFEEAVADANGEINWTAISAMYAGVGVAGRRYEPNATAVVGVLPPGWFAKHMNSANTLGLELQNVKGAVTSMITPHFLNYQVAAHEIGHTFGLLDDYNFGISPPRNGWIIDSDGFWLNKPAAVKTPHYYAVDDTSSQLGGYISFMGAAGAPIWVDKCTYEYLRDAISSGKEPTQYDCANSPGPDAKSADAR